MLSIHVVEERPGRASRNFAQHTADGDDKVKGKIESECSTLESSSADTGVEASEPPRLLGRET